ncbi:methyltransferase [Buchnera aphidicola]|uniref:methyltransferase n=1 Tax=Buchnera aphidicola TaxID=9 RepID=UPI00130DC935|nr:methyltransferase [Buchnera aphidicola (Stegophylla sp.)]
MNDKNHILILNHKKIMNKRFLVFNDIQNNIDLYFKSKNLIIHTKKKLLLDFYKSFLKYNKYNMIFNKNYCISFNTLIYFWKKNKSESILQLHYLLSIVSIYSDIFIIGQNNIGINSTKKLCNPFVHLNKINYKKKCSLYYGIITKKSNFILQKHFKIYIWNNIIIQTLPGVFGYRGLDKGSLLLISTFHKNITGQVLDIGSGSGILSVILKKIAVNTEITLVDNNNIALLCSKNTLRYNNIIGTVLFSNIYSNINNKFDLIISNPPTHCGKKNNFNIIKHIIQNSVKYLKKNGILRIVIHSYISCHKELLKTFNNYTIIKQMNHFCVYQSILKKKN